MLQHTDCGITRLVCDPAMLAKYFEIEEDALKSKAASDPHVAVTVTLLCSDRFTVLPGEWLVSGLAYDVATGLAAIVVPPMSIEAM